MIIAWILFFVMYMQCGKDEEFYKIGELAQFRRAAEMFDLTSNPGDYFKISNPETEEEKTGLLDEGKITISPAKKLFQQIDSLSHSRIGNVIVYKF